MFTLIALFANLMNSIGMLPLALDDAIKAIVSYYRIKKYLNEKEVD